MRAYRSRQRAGRNAVTDAERVTRVTPVTAEVSPKQERFAREFAATLNASEAARRAGYSLASAPSQASVLMQNPNVQAAIAELSTAVAARLGLNHEWVLANLREIVERCMQAAPVRDARGRVVEGEWTFDARGATRALELLAKHLGMFKADNEQQKAPLSFTLNIDGPVTVRPQSERA